MNQKKTPKEVRLKAKEDSYHILERESEEWLNKLQRLKEMIVMYESEDMGWISTKDIRKVIGWELGKDYRIESSGN